MQNSIEEKFFELLRVSIGTQKVLTTSPTDVEWRMLFEQAAKQSLSGVMLEGVNKLKNASINLNIEKKLLLEWIGIRQITISTNEVQNKRVKELYDIFKDGGYRSCVLKGQGTALYYDRPEFRQSGDIDLWVEGNRDVVVAFVRSKGIRVENVDIKDSTMYFFNDVTVEVHWRPNCMFNPWTDKNLQLFFKEQAKQQFSAFDDSHGFAHTTIEFDLVYSLVHIYRHIFSEGIGLRQLLDYYYILHHSTKSQREEAFRTICGFGMKLFVGGIMWILLEKFGMNKEQALCGVNERHGVFLLNEILIGGNFGQYDTRYNIASKDRKFRRGITMLKRNLHYICLYPSEVLWSPLWKLWHWCWRKQKGYL